MGNAIIAIVKGGLGNQLFIYAAARALALRTGRMLYLDTRRGYTHDTYDRNYRLDRFPITAEPMPEEWQVASTLKHPRHKLIRALNKLLPRNRRSYLAERHHLDASQLTALRPARERVTLLGYWQDEAYFAAYAGVIRSELAPPAPTDARNLELGDNMVATNSVFLHIRRVRYPRQLASGYYQAAITQVRSSIPGARFYVFGDDMAWARRELDFGRDAAVFVDHNGADELADFWLMTRCRHAIVANSSFSWWAAWLQRDGARHWAPKEPGLPLVFPFSWQMI